MNRKTHDIVMKTLVLASVLFTAFVLIQILFYILSNGLPHVTVQFLTSKYNPTFGEYGILPMIINTIYMIVLTLVIACPIGISTAIYLTQYAKDGKLTRLVRLTTEILSGIPSIIYGLFGSMFFVVTLKMSYSILAGALTLTIMILPTIIRTTEEAIKAVNKSYIEGALALGATKIKVIFTIVLPNAISGILTSVVLSMGRVVGESAALMYTAGIVYKMPTDLFEHVMSSGRTLTLHLYQLAMLGEPLEQSFATAAVLLIIVFSLNILASTLAKKLRKV